MPRVMIAGDTHGDLNHLQKLLKWAQREHTGVDFMFQVGDWGYTFPHPLEPGEKPWRRVDRASEWCQEAGIPMWFVEGNHDNYIWLQEIGAWDSTGPIEVAPFITYCPRGSTWEWDGIRCMAIGGGISVDRFKADGSRYRYSYDELRESLPDAKHEYIAHQKTSYWPEEEITDADVERCEDAGLVDILFSHDAPDTPELQGYLESFGMNLPYKVDESSKKNRAQMNRIVDAAQPKYVFHGHYHNRYNGHRGDSQIIGLSCNGTGVMSHAVVDLAEILEPV